MIVKWEDRIVGDGIVTNAIIRNAMRAEINELREMYSKLTSQHPRLEIRYWTGEYWDTLYGDKLESAIKDIEPAPELNFRW